MKNLQVGCSYHHSLWGKDITIDTAEMLYMNHEHLLPISINDKSIQQIGFVETLDSDDEYGVYSHTLSESEEIIYRIELTIHKKEYMASLIFFSEKGTIELDVNYIHEVQQLFNLAYGIIPTIDFNF